MEGEASNGPDLRVDPLTLGEVEATLSAAELSDWFDPFLTSWARESLRAGGQALVARSGDQLVGLLLSDPTDRTASVFSRSPTVAESLGLAAVGRAVFAPVDLGGPRERFWVMACEPTVAPDLRLRHRSRFLRAGDAAEVAGLLREVYGGAPERWLEVAASEGETGFGVEADGELAGVGWAHVVGTVARLHTLTVRPSRRRLGIGAALLAARILYARQAGAGRLLAEASDQNAASLAILRGAGFVPVGELYLYPPPLGSELGRGAAA